MAAQWYCRAGQKEFGPFTSEQIQQLVARGKLKPEHFVRPETDSHWTQASDIPGLFPAAAAPAPAPARTTPVAMPAVPPAAVPATPVAAPVYIQPAMPVATVAPVQPAIPVARPLAPTAAPVAVAVAQAPAATPGFVPPAPPPGAPGRREGTAAHARKPRNQGPLIVGGLVAVLLVLGIVAAVVLSRTPKGKPTAKSDDRPLAGQAPAAVKPVALNADPEADPEADPATPDAPDAASAAAPDAAMGGGTGGSTSGMPDVKKWLIAPRQKGGLKEIARIGVTKAWLEPQASKTELLNVEVEVANLSDEESLSFKPWTGEAGPSGIAGAVLCDDKGVRLKCLPGRAASGRSATARKTIEPGESHLQRMAFLAPSPDAAMFRLALSYAAVGQNGYIGFEISREILQEPAEPEPKQTAKPEPKPDEEDAPVPETVVDESPTMTAREKAEKNRDLKSQIDAEDTEPSTPAPDLPEMPDEDQPPPADEKMDGGEPASAPDLKESIDNEGDSPMNAPGGAMEENGENSEDAQQS